MVRVTVVLLAILSMTLPLFAQANLINQCTTECSRRICLPEDFTPGGLQGCFRNCRRNCEARLRTVVLHPKYYLLTIIYAPPGCTSSANAPCIDRGSVLYSTESTTGSTTSVSSSFTSGSNLSVERNLSIAGISLFDTTSSTGFATTVTQTNSLTVSKGEGLQLRADGNGDGIDHGNDIFVLLLNPAVVVQSLGAGSNWNMGLAGASAITLNVAASELRNPATMPAGVAAEFQRRGFTAADFLTILAQDPFAAGATTVDPARFARTRWTLSYRPPTTTGACLLASPFITNDLLQEHVLQTQAEYSVGLATHIPLLRLTSQDQFTFTSTNTQATRRGSGNRAQTTIPCPSQNYTGPVLMDIYWDTLYSSFLFATNTDPILQAGVVIGANGDPLRNEEVVLHIGGETRYTVTDNEGRYQFAAPGGSQDNAGATGLLLVRNTRTSVTTGENSRVRIE
jgi:hypothetical protein